MSNNISISKDFSATPGARYISDGPFSGEQFRKEKLEPIFANPSDNTKILIDLDGTEGYATSFLEESFGGLARAFGKDRVLARLQFKSEEEPLLVDEIQNYIEHCNDK